MTASSRVVEKHVAAFNARDLDRLLECFHADALWITGTDRFRGTAELRELFAGAFSAFGPKLTIMTMIFDGDLVACELREELVVDGLPRIDYIAAFYRVRNGLIDAGKVYREGSADPMT